MGVHVTTSSGVVFHNPANDDTREVNHCRARASHQNLSRISGMKEYDLENPR